MTSRWTFLTSHGAVLLFKRQHPSSKAREVAEAVGITERGVHNVLRDLEDAGYLRKTRSGKRVTYRLNSDRTMRHPLVEDLPVSLLIDVLLEAKKPSDE